MGAARAKWLRASGRLKSDDARVAAFRPRHVAVCLRPQAVRAASRSASQVAAHALRLILRLYSLSHGRSAYEKVNGKPNIEILECAKIAENHSFHSWRHLGTLKSIQKPSF